MRSFVNLGNRLVDIDDIGDWRRCQRSRVSVPDNRLADENVLIEKSRRDRKNISIVGNARIELWYQPSLNIKSCDRISIGE
jgi:hypothetical protein